MKAKEYAEKYLADPTTKTVGEIGNAFLREMSDLSKQRKVSTNRGAIAILNELEQKWKAFVRLTDDKETDEGFLDEGFAQLVKIAKPEVYEAWKGFRKAYTKRLINPRGNQN